MDLQGTFIMIIQTPTTVIGDLVIFLTYQNVLNLIPLVLYLIMYISCLLSNKPTIEIKLELTLKLLILFCV